MSSPAVVPGAFGLPAQRRSVLDPAHQGDIEGALGRIPSHDTAPRVTSRRRLATLLALMGPGLVVMAADNDAGGISIYAQAGQNYGLHLLWPLLLLAPVLFVNQEMVARLGAVTGAGHARLIFERFGRRWGAFALGDLLALNVLTIVTELIGVRLACAYFGISPYLAVPLAGAALVLFTVTGSFRRWERAMYVLIALTLVGIPLAVLANPGPDVAAQALPALSHGPEGGLMLFLIALVGTTVAPWQFFFHQSNVVDKRITSRWLPYERLDTLVGTLVFAMGAVAVLAACAFAFAGTSLHGQFTDAGAVAHDLEARLGAPAGALFALGLLDASLLGAAIVALSTAYAVGDVAGTKQSLHRDWRDARIFHGTFVVVIVLAVALVVSPGLPLGLVTTGVQALAGVLLPSASVFLLLLCNDRAVLGPWVNPRWLNAVGVIVVGGLVELSTLLILTTLFPGLNVRIAAGVLTAAFGLLIAMSLLALRRGASPAPECFVGTPWERISWTMPRLESLAPPPSSRARTAGLVALRLYLMLAAVLLIAKLVQLA